MAYTLDDDFTNANDLDPGPVRGRSSTIAAGPAETDATALHETALAPPAVAANAPPGQGIAVQYYDAPANPTLAKEVTYISGLNPDGTLALYSFAAWNPDTKPADYSGGYTNAIKWYGTPSASTAGTPGGAVTYAFDPTLSSDKQWNKIEENAFTAVLDLWSAVANISFTLTTDYTHAGIQITRGSDGKATTSYDANVPAGAGVTGGTQLLQFTQADISIDTSPPSPNGPSGFGPIDGSFMTDGGYPWTTMIHEMGHAIGLGHGGPYNEGETDIDPPSVQYSPYDSRLYSVMSYIDPTDTSAKDYSQYPVTGTNWGDDYTSPYVFPNSPTTWMPLDILAAEEIYGTPTSTPLSGGQTFGFHESGFSGTAGTAIAPFFDFTQNTSPVITIWDAGTGNTLDLSGFTTNDTVNLTPGSYSSAGTDVTANGHTVNNMVNNIVIAYHTLIDALVLGSGNDTVIANNDGDTITGGGGNDTITGGTGNDALYGGSGTNTLNGGAGIDTAYFSGNRASYTLTHNGDGTWTVSGSGETDTLSNIESVNFSDAVVALTTTTKVTSDFNGDHKSDILWQNPVSGQTQIWMMNGTDILSGNNLPPANLGASWQVKGTSDFNGDGESDILWQNAVSGQTQIWMMNGTDIMSGNNLPPANLGASWQVKGTGDFNGDGKSDILWQNAVSGQTQIWMMNGTDIMSGNNLPPANLGTAWQIKGTGDFNGDGKSDILWQNAVSGQTQIWMMNGTDILSGNNLPPANLGIGWEVRGVGDFNGDGKSDILWQNAGGQTQIWMMNGTDIMSGNNLPPANLGTAWQIKGVGDFNGDGKSDILFQNASGQTQIWMMNGTDILSGNNLPPANLGTSWSVTGSLPSPTQHAASDFNGDGKSDILYQNAGGQTQIWMMNGTDIMSGNNLPPANLGTAWQIKGVGDFNGDGKSDILFQNASGQTQIWMMTGTDIMSGNNLPPANLGTAWQIKGVGDFNGDGKSDILYQNASGQTQIWMMTGTDIMSGNNLPPANLGTAWQIKGVGDFNGDGKSDILYQNAGGQTQIWMMNGTDIMSGNNLPPANLGTAWQIKGVGDFNGDGKSDILYQNASGQTQIWMMNGTDIMSGNNLPPANLGTPWQIKGVGDFNGDGKSDILFQNASGQTQIWMMTGTDIMSGNNLPPANLGTSWHIASGG